MPAVSAFGVAEGAGVPVAVGLGAAAFGPLSRVVFVFDVRPAFVPQRPPAQADDARAREARTAAAATNLFMTPKA